MGIDFWRRRATLIYVERTYAPTGAGKVDIPMIKIGFIDYFLDEWHAINYPAWIKEASNGEMEVAYAYGMIDSPRQGGRTTEQFCKDLGIERCYSIDEVIEKSDMLVVLSPDNCEMHEALCQAPLRSGKRTYIDKTFAPDGEIARRIFAVAEASNTPCWSTSALRFADEYQGIENAKFVAAWGPNGFDTYSIHQLEPIFMMMGATPKRVMATVGEGYTTHTFEMTDGRGATVTNMIGGGPFASNIVCEDGSVKTVMVNSNFFMTFIKDLVKFFETGVVPVSHETTCNIMDAYGAGKLALKTPGEWVNI